MDVKQYKIVLIGNASVGKTSILLMYTYKTFPNPKHKVTLQVTFETKRISRQGKRIDFNIWDTAGQERFHSLGPIYYRGTYGAVLVFDITDLNSFLRIQNYHKELRKFGDIAFAIVGNKIDLESNRVVSKDEAITFAESTGGIYYETSAKLNYGVDEVFLGLADQILAKENKELTLPSPSGFVIGKSKPAKEEQKCCLSDISPYSDKPKTALQEPMNDTITNKILDPKPQTLEKKPNTVFQEPMNDNIITNKILDPKPQLEKMEQTGDDGTIEIKKEKVETPPVEVPPVNKNVPWLFPQDMWDSRFWRDNDGYQYLVMTQEKKKFDKAYSFVEDLWHKYDNPYSITKIVAIKNLSLQQIWERKIGILQTRSNSISFKPNWESQGEIEHRKAIMRRIENFVFGKDGNVMFVPIFHGTKSASEVVNQICQTGFANLGITDNGYFGKGIYGTPQAEYAARVYGKGVCFLCVIAILNPFPVIFSDMVDLSGGGNFGNCDAHYVPVVHKNGPVYMATKPAEKPIYDEFVVFQDSQIIPRYVIYYTN